MRKISLITVCYNSAAFLEDTFKSVLSQTYPEFEYIVVDGGSTDGTVDLIRKYDLLFKGRMRWISERDEGMYDAINKGIRISDGEIVGLLNSDDFFSSDDILYKVAESFEANSSVSAIFGDVRLVRPDNLSKTFRYYSSRSWKPWKFRFGLMPAHPSFYSFRSNFDKYGYYKLDYEISADFELLVRHLYRSGVKYKYVPLDFVTMRTGGKSTRGLRSFWTLSKEDVRGCRENEIWTCIPLMLLRGGLKAIEVLKAAKR